MRYILPKLDQINDLYVSGADITTDGRFEDLWNCVCKYNSGMKQNLLDLDKASLDAYLRE